MLKTDRLTLHIEVFYVTFHLKQEEDHDVVIGNLENQELCDR